MIHNIKPYKDPSNIGLAVLSFEYPAFGIDNFVSCAYKINHFQADYPIETKLMRSKYGF
jgi:hypothetical protein